jgi:uncharacterized protein (TIGR03437 family)
LLRLNRLAELLAVATVVLLGHPDTAKGQTLSFSPSPVALSISGPGATAMQVVTVTASNGTGITSLFVSPINTTSGGNWLSAQASSNTFTLSATNTSSLTPGATYNGTAVVTANGNNSLTGTINVSLTVGSTSGNGNGLIATPSQISFTETVPGQATPASQNVSVALNGVIQPITSVIFTPTPLTGPTFVNSQAGANGSYNFSVNSIVTTNGFYSGNATLFTNSGSITLPINLTFGSAGSSLVVNPNPVNLTSPVGGSSGTQNVGVTFNGAAVTISSVNAFTQTIPNWMVTSFSGNVVFVSANAAGLVTGNYTGNVTVVTSVGTTGFTVNLSVVSGTNANLTATPNPVTFSVQSGGTATSQNVNITFNGTPVTVNSAVPSTNTGQNWLVLSPQGSSVNVGINSTGLGSGSYTGTATVNTTQGQLTFTVNLTVSGSPTLSVNQTALNFAFQTGTSNPQVQTVAVTSNGTNVSFSVTTFTNSGGTGWLVASQQGQTLTTPNTLTIAVQPAGLAAGITYTGGVVINTSGGATNGSITIPVSLLVSNNPILSASPSSLTFTTAQGGAPASQTLTLASSSTPLNYTLTSTITTPPGGIWLQVPTQSGPTPGNITVTVNTQGLAPGTYNGTINVTSSNAGNPSLSVPVTLTITAGALLQLSPGTLSFAYQIGQAQPPGQTISVASDSALVGYSVSSTTTTGQTWLNISTNNGATPGNFVVSVNTAGLTPGPYSGTVTVTPNASAGPPQTIPVTLVVSNTALLLVSPGSLTFTVPQGATSSSFQNVAVTSTDGTPISFTVGATTGSLSNWLLVSSSSGTTASNLSISANPNGLPVGTYTGTVTITATAPATVTNTPQTIAVTLKITPTTTLSVSANSLSFTQLLNSPAPASQNLNVSSSAGSITFAATATVNQGLNWLAVSPSSGITTPATLTVSVNGTGLQPGMYTGQIVLSSPGAASSQTVIVTLNITNSPTITVSPATLAPVSFQIGSASPQAQTIFVSLAGGGAAAFNATASTTTGGSWLAVSPGSGNTPQNISVTINPAGLAASTTSYQGSISIVVAGATNSPLILPITLTVTPAPVIAPTIVGVQNAASSIPTSLSPGLNILIFGTNMGPATLTPYVIGSNGALANTVAGTQVTFDGIPSAIIYTRNTLVSVMVPYEIAGRVSTAMVVTYNGASSAPLQLRVVDSVPGIYTLTQTGTGQGAILNQNGTVNSTANPEVVGNYIQIFGTGEGQTSPQGVDGLLLPARLPLPTPNLLVEVSIGGIAIAATDINYAGEAPGIISGVIQVNAKIPAGVGPGAVPVVFKVGGVPSQANVTVSVR